MQTVQTVSEALGDPAFVAALGVVNGMTGAEIEAAAARALGVDLTGSAAAETPADDSGA